MNIITHPRWCRTARCEASLGGSHTSDPIIIGRDKTSPARVQLRLWQPPTAESVARIEFEAGDHVTGQRGRIDLSLEQAQMVNLGLISLLMRAAAL